MGSLLTDYRVFDNFIHRRPSLRSQAYCTVRWPWETLEKSICVWLKQRRTSWPHSALSFTALYKPFLHGWRTLSAHIIQRIPPRRTHRRTPSLQSALKCILCCQTWATHAALHSHNHSLTHSLHNADWSHSVYTTMKLNCYAISTKL